MYKKNIVLIILVLLFLVTKLTILAFLSNTTMIINDDELFYGAIAKEITNGPILPFFDYQIRPWEGGGLIVSALASLFFIIFGDSLFSLKLVGILFSLGILIMLYLFLIKNFNSRVAVIASLLFIFPSTLLVQRSLMTFGNHFESIFFTITTMFIFFRIFFNDKGKKNNNLYFVLFGLISGFGTYFCYTFLLALFICLLFWFVFNKRFIFEKQFYIFILSFIVGFSPWIYFNLTNNFLGLIVKEKSILSHFLTNNLSYSLIRLKKFIFFDILNSFKPDGLSMLGSKVIALTYYILFLVSFVSLLWINRKSIGKFFLGLIPEKRFNLSPANISRETIFVVYMIAFSFIYSFTDFMFDDPRLFKCYKHVIPLLPFIFITIALFLNKIFSKKGIYAFSAMLFLIILLFNSFLSNLNSISLHNFGNIFRYKGFSYTKFGYLIGMRFNGRNLTDCIALINKFPATEFKSDCYYGFGRKLAKLYGIKINEAIPIMDKIETRYKAYCYYGLGEEIGNNITNNLLALTNIIKIAKQIDKKYQPYFIEGLGLKMDWLIKDNIDLDVINSAIGGLNENYKEHFYKGVISSFNEFLGYDKYIELINKLPERYKPVAYEGLGIGIGDAFLFDDANTAINLVDNVEEKYRWNCYLGLGIEMGNVIKDDINKCIHLIDKINIKYKPYCYQGLKMSIDGEKLSKLGFKTELLIF